jgi:hypothetical protein
MHKFLSARDDPGTVEVHTRLRIIRHYIFSHKAPAFGKLALASNSPTDFSDPNPFLSQIPTPMTCSNVIPLQVISRQTLVAQVDRALTIPHPAFA